MEIVVLRPLRPYSAPQCQCEGKVDKPWGCKRYNEERKRRAAHRGVDPAGCQKGASYKIDGHYLCSQHAAQLLLQLLNEGRVTVT